MDPIKEAFTRAKQDIEDLKAQLSQALQEIQEIKRTLIQQQLPTQHSLQQTNQPPIPTQELNELPNMPLYALKSQNTHISTGNRGVPTNQPTNQQTNQRTGNRGVGGIPTPSAEVANTSSPTLERLEQVSQMLSSLDEIKKDIRAQFKKLTVQEMHVFALVYQLEEQGFTVDYALLSAKTSLSEISIRDYIHKLIKKGVPLAKQKLDNKKIMLSISPQLKQIASLQTIVALREL